VQVSAARIAFSHLQNDVGQSVRKRSGRRKSWASGTKEKKEERGGGRKRRGRGRKKRRGKKVDEK